MNLSVAELIAVLEKVEDKSLPVKICTDRLAHSISKVALAKTSSAVIPGKDKSKALIIKA